MTPETEAQLISRCRRGDNAAWDEVFDLHYAAVARFVFQLSPDFTQEDAQEICQDAFLSAIRSMGTFQGGSRLQTWLFRIACNKARDYRQRVKAVKRGGRETTVSLDVENPETGKTIDPPSYAPGPDAVLAQKERVAQIGRALNHLNDPCREVIELRYFGDFSYEEIATELKLNEKTVSSRLSKCLDRLEKIVTDIFSEKQPGAVSV